LPAHQVKDGLLRAAWAELFLARQHYEEAEVVLTQPEQISIHWFSFNVTPYTNLLLALAYWGQKKFVQAHQEMMRAINLAEPEGIIRPFLDCGSQIIPLLSSVLGAKKLSRVQHQFVCQLLDLFRAAHPAVSIPSAEEMAGSVSAQLSPREREILQLLEAGLDNKALAQRLVVSDSTVRTHLRNLYRKLEVTSRIQAIKRARELGLL
jgi:LuxR family maltose regulon positive regulatory protein